MPAPTTSLEASPDNERCPHSAPPPPPVAQEPWEREGLNSYQIMMSLQQGQRPLVPPAGELPGQLGPPAEVAEYTQLMEACWDRWGCWQAGC